MDLDIKLVPLWNWELPPKRAIAPIFSCIRFRNVFVHLRKDVYFKLEAQTTFLLSGSGLPVLRPSSGSPNHQVKLLKSFQQRSHMIYSMTYLTLKRQGQKQRGKLGGSYNNLGKR